MTNTVWCECSGKTGFVNLGIGNAEQWWVCSACMKPTKQVWEKRQEDGVLNYFRGGPIDGYAYETTVLLSPEAFNIPELDRYMWTPEIITSEKTGARARVWVYPTEAPEDGSETVPETTEPQPVVDANQYLARRKALKLTRAQLSELSGINQSQLSRLETGSGSVKAGVPEAVDEALRKIEFERNPS